VLGERGEGVRQGPWTGRPVVSYDGLDRTIGRLPIRPAGAGRLVRTIGSAFDAEANVSSSRHDCATEQGRSNCI
jgi:hypothetical protein